MSPTTTPTEAPLELDHRAGDGLEVWLLWTASTNRLFVLVVDTKLEDAFELDVAAQDALDAFRHPYAYAAFGHVTYRAASAGRRTTIVG